MKSFGHQKTKFHAWVKSALLGIFQKSANWLDWPCSASAALQNCPQDLFSFIFYLLFIFLKYEILVRSSASSVCHSNPNPSSAVQCRRQPSLTPLKSYLIHHIIGQLYNQITDDILPSSLSDPI